MVGWGNVSGYGNESGPIAKTKDPLVRFLGGCALVVGALVALVVVGVVLVSWRLTRDESPGRPPETFLVGDETRYWCIDLQPQDAGMRALFDRWAEINESARRAMVRGTFLENVPLPTRRAPLEDVAPLTLELSLWMSDPAKGLQVREGWAGRGTLSHGMFKVRAALKLMRWVFTRDARAGETFDVDGVTVTHRRDQAVEFAIATVGNRVIVANDDARMRAILEMHPRRSQPEIGALHDVAKLEGEDGWAFASKLRLPGMSNPVTLPLAAASFDVNAKDELAFKIAVADGATVEETRSFRGTALDCVAVASSFLPGVPAEAIVIDGEGARPAERGVLVFTGRIPGLSERLAALLAMSTEHRRRGRTHDPSEPETPSATPTPPSPPASSDPRNGTRAGPRHGETPTPPR